MSKPKLEQTIKDYFDQYGAILVGMHQDLQGQQLIIDRKLAEAENQIVELIDQFETRSSNIISEAESLSIKLQNDILNHKKITESALNEYKTINAKQHKEFEQRKFELLEMHQQVINYLQEINQKTEDHLLREAKFNKRMRQIIIGFAAVASIGVLVTVFLWYQ